jgi:hypothetical protein
LVSFDDAVMMKRIGRAALAFAAVALFATACGSTDDLKPAADAGPSSGSDYTSCLRDNGVNLPQGNTTDRPSGRPSGLPTVRPSGGGLPGGGRPGGGPGGGGNGTAAPDGVDQQTWEKAQKACESLRPTTFPGGGGGNSGAGGDAAFRNCLTDRGVTVTGSIDQLDSTDAKVASALQACGPLRPSARPSAS